MLTETRILPVIAAVFCLCLCCGRTDEEVVVAGLSVGGFTGDIVRTEAGFCGGVPITVESNVDWTAVSSAPSWVELYPSEGRGGEFCEPQVYFKNRNYSDVRTATITISAAGKTCSFNVEQAAYDPKAYGRDDPEAVTDGHPCLLASGDEFTRIRKAAVRSGSILNVMHTYIMRFADASLASPPVKYELSGNRLLNVCAEALKRVFYLSYAYRFTGEPEYALRVEKELLAISAFKDWNPSNFIEPSEMMMAVAIGYDWCYPRIAEESKAKILDALKSKGLDRYFEWGGAQNNFNQVCNTGALYGAAVYRDREPDCYEAVKNRAVEMIKIAMSGYNPDGTYVEGPGYWNYGTSYNTLFLDFLQRSYGNTCGLLEEFPSFLKTGDYINAVITPSFRVFDYSDQGFPAQISIVPFYLYDLSGNGSVLSTQKRMLERSMLNYDHCRHERLLPSAMVFASRRDLGNVGGSDPVRAFVGGGETPLAALRGTSYIAMKLGHPDTGHGHMDIGTFCFESDGVQWSTDLGGEAYGAIESAGVDLWSYTQGSERWSLLRCGPQGHSILTFDGKEQTVGARGDFVSSDVSDPEDMSATADLTPLYAYAAEKVRRTIRLREGRTGETIDEIEVGEKDVTLRWQMVSEAVSVHADSRGALLTSKNGMQLRLDVEGPEQFTLSWRRAAPVLACESDNSELIVAFETRLPAGSANKITVRLTPICK